MDAHQLTLAAQLSWLVLCGMMIVSRFSFRQEGAEGMRRFLDAWKLSRTHRIWGLAAGLWGVVLLAGAALHWASLTALDSLVIGSVAAVLCADGLLNLLPSGFANFKERMQDAWVKRHEGGERASDEHLFATVNLLLGLAATGVAVAVYLYRPLPLGWLAMTAALAIVLTFVLIAACKHEARKTRQDRP